MLTDHESHWPTAHGSYKQVNNTTFRWGVSKLHYILRLFPHGKQRRVYMNMLQPITYYLYSFFFILALISKIRINIILSDWKICTIQKGYEKTWLYNLACILLMQKRFKLGSSTTIPPLLSKFYFHYHVLMVKK